MPSPSALLLSLAVAATSVLAQDCDCYLIDGDYPTYYLQHDFWDFRSLSEYAVASPPPIPDTREGNADAPETSAYFADGSHFKSFWWPMNWVLPIGDDFANVNSRNNLYIETNADGDAPESDTFLTMRTARRPDFQTNTEFESVGVVDHASMRMRARSFGASGACTAIFTFVDGNPVQEADIEMLTRDSPTAIHYTNQPSIDEDENEIPGAHNNVTVSPPWTEWVDHRLDWTPGRTTWWYNGEQKHSQEFQAPRDPSKILLNAWSDGRVWTGLMEEGGEAFQQVQWIEIAWDVTDGASCQNVCSVDDGAAPGLLKKL